jgi:hypothetical protein
MIRRKYSDKTSKTKERPHDFFIILHTSFLLVIQLFYGRPLCVGETA